MYLSYRLYTYTYAHAYAHTFKHTHDHNSTYLFLTLIFSSFSITNSYSLKQAIPFLQRASYAYNIILHSLTHIPLYSSSLPSSLHLSFTFLSSPSSSLTLTYKASLHFQSHMFQSTGKLTQPNATTISQQ